MSLKLTRALLEQQSYTQIQKHILMILCLLSLDNNEVFCDIPRLANYASCSIKTIERTLSYFRKIKILNYTGKFTGESLKIPIYRINLDHGLPVGDKTFITDSQSLDHGLSGHEITDSQSVHIDNNKDNNKDNSKTFCFLNFKPRKDKKFSAPELSQIKFWSENPEWVISNDDKKLFEPR